MTVPHNFVSRPYQEEFFYAMNNGCKRAMLVHHRRAGKDICAWNWMVQAAVEKRGIYYYIFPTFSQGRKVLWDGMTNDGMHFLDFIPKELIAHKNNQEMKIRLITGSLIQVVGSDKIDSIMGTNPVGAVFSEYSLQSPRAWDFIRPILDINGGWAVFVMTPRGQNFAKELYDMAKRSKSWYTSLLTVKDTGLLTDEDIKRIQDEGMSLDMVMQEYYCSFTMGIQGSYYSRYIDEAYDDKRISIVPYQRSSKVCTAFDIGYSDSTVIIFFQCIGNSVHIFDHLECRGEPMSYYAEILHSRKYIYDRHFAPHDIESTDFARGISPKDVAASLDIDFTVIPMTKIMEGIECVRGMFPRFYIDEFRCKDLITALTNYRSEYDERKGIYSSKPLHDKYSHSADALRYLALGVSKFIDTKYKTIDNQEYKNLRDTYLPRFN